jgi:hypothetical protein
MTSVRIYAAAAKFVNGEIAAKGLCKAKCL